MTIKEKIISMTDKEILDTYNELRKMLPLKQMTKERQLEIKKKRELKRWKLSDDR